MALVLAAAEGEQALGLRRRERAAKANACARERSAACGGLSREPPQLLHSRLQPRGAL
eukprot:CAMPEP_0202771006 /NCGR_PEP_ID=MMETSP1388-20130828/39906_1 /ASSEMBLY_ACC=CAM_ASM_000864 /TAXON_ID=37098 /ORGANISM="Isochrysis sp, Strain CCMP1244" /LENGTH=57 /DNA_ID=CAMNT_0049439885 /DNA_START=86 /DNA_END=256 /DNA_ORIENTATION=+